MALKETLARDWSFLLPEVLNLIAKNLSEISDFVRFRAVCKAWSSSTPITDLPPQFPWILEDHGYRFEGDLEFYSIPSNKLYTIHSPKFVNKYLYKRIEGYMAALQNGHLSLLNPLNNHEIPLLTCDFKFYPPWYIHWQNRMGESVVYIRLVSSDYKYKLCSCHLGQDNWHVLLESEYRTCDHFFHNDMLFTVDFDTGATKVTDTTTGALVYVVPPVEDRVAMGIVHLVEASGDILRFNQYHDQSDVFPYNYQFDVHRLDVDENGSPCWVKVKNIGNHAFFVDMEGGFVLKANDMARIEANSIYFIDEVSVRNSRRNIHEVKKIDIDTGATETFQFPFKSTVGWFVPNFHHL